MKSQHKRLIKTLVQYWDQCDPPEPIAARMQAWKQHHPDWSYQRFERIQAGQWIGEVYGDIHKHAFFNLRFPAMQADVFRIAYLQQKGGLWVDAATECLMPVSGWLDPSAPLTLLRRPHQHQAGVWNGLIYAANANHPLLSAAWKRISNVIINKEEGNIFDLVGPRLLRHLLQAGNFDQNVHILQSVDLEKALLIGSSSKIMGADQHWSRRQQKESLYIE